MTEVALEMPEIDFGPHKISRLIVGGNQQIGATHQSKLMTQHMLEYFTVDQTVEFLKDCIAAGINTWQANYNPKVRDAVKILREEGEAMNLISLSSPQIADNKNGWQNLLDMEPIGIYLFGWTADIWYSQGKLDQAYDFLARIRDTGVQVGLGSHRPEVIEYAEEKGWDIDFYTTSLYWWGRTKEQILDLLPEVPHDGHNGMEIYLPSELPRMCETVRQTDKTCLVFKLFAGGRTCDTTEQVGEIFENVLGNIKSKDAVIVGMYPRFKDEINENANFVRKFSLKKDLG